MTISQDAFLREPVKYLLDTSPIAVETQHGNRFLISEEEYENMQLLIDIQVAEVEYLRGEFLTEEQMTKHRKELLGILKCKK